MSLETTSDEDIERQLSGEAVRGPRVWRGKELAPLTRGLRDLHWKVIKIDSDTGSFFDIALVYILSEAHDSDQAKRLEKRRRLLSETDDVETFRAQISVIMDDLTDAEADEAKEIVSELLDLAKKAEVVPVEKKSEVTPSAVPSQTKTHSPSGKSRKGRGGRRTSSAGK